MTCHWLIASICSYYLPKCFGKFTPLSHGDNFMNNCLFLFIFDMEITIHSFPLQPYTWLTLTKHIFRSIHCQRQYHFGLFTISILCTYNMTFVPEGHLVAFTFILPSFSLACLAIDSAGRVYVTCKRRTADVCGLSSIHLLFFFLLSFCRYACFVSIQLAASITIDSHQRSPLRLSQFRQALCLK